MYRDPGLCRLFLGGKQFEELRKMLPFIHYKLELPELLQGILMIAVGLSAVPILEESLGFSYEAR